MSNSSSISRQGAMKKVVLFFGVATCLVGMFVWLNVSQWNERVAKDFPKADLSKQLSYLFQNGHIHPRVSLGLYRAGISTRPDRTVVGQSGWMFLGDAYNQLVSKANGNFEESPEEIANWSRLAKQRVDSLSQKGIPLVFLIAPNKHSIYPEKAPPWLPFHEITVTDRLLAATEEWDAPIVDPRDALRKAKQADRPVYGVTETHWTHLGAFVAFQALEDAIEEQIQGLIKLPDTKVDFTVERLPACCLARFIGIAGLLPKQHEVLMRMHMPDGVSYLCGGDKPKGEDRDTCKDINNAEPLKIGKVSLPVSSNARALNDMHVLLIRDSFGAATAPLFDFSFSKVTQLHVGHLAMKPNLLDKVISEIEPELVVFQVVERNLLLPFWGGERQATQLERNKKLPI